MHWRDGIKFERSPNGAVHIHKDGAFNFTIPADEWASIVASVSDGPQTGIEGGDRWRQALYFHGGDEMKARVARSDP